MCEGSGSIDCPMSEHMAPAGPRWPRHPVRRTAVPATWDVTSEVLIPRTVAIPESDAEVDQGVGAQRVVQRYGVSSSVPDSDAEPYGEPDLQSDSESDPEAREMSSIVPLVDSVVDVSDGASMRGEAGTGQEDEVMGKHSVSRETSTDVVSRSGMSKEGEPRMGNMPGYSEQLPPAAPPPAPNAAQRVDAAPPPAKTGAGRVTTAGDDLAGGSKPGGGTSATDRARLAAGFLRQVAPLPKPEETRIVAVANQKGGVGKTTSAVNVAAALAASGQTVLVLDSDPQGNASTALGVEHHPGISGLYEVLIEGMPLAEVVRSCPDVPGLMCAPATIDLAGAEIELVPLVAREMRLSKAIEAYQEMRLAQGLLRLDYVIVDCPPSLGLLTVNAFVAAREVLIPIQCEYYALEGLSQLLKNIGLIQQHLNPQLHVSSILLTMYDGRTRLASQVADEVREHFPGVVMETMVPRSVRISEAPSYGQTVITYDPTSTGTKTYLRAAQELSGRM